MQQSSVMGPTFLYKQPRPFANFVRQIVRDSIRKSIPIHRHCQRQMMSVQRFDFSTNFQRDVDLILLRSKNNYKSYTLTRHNRLRL